MTIKNPFLVLKNAIVKQKTDVMSVAEDIVDNFILNEDVMKEIPFVNYAVSTLNIKDAYHQARMLKNYKAFIEAVHDMKEEDKHKYFEKISVNEQIADDVIDSMYGILLESERDIKAKAMGNLIKALVNDNINLEDYNTLLLIIQSSSVPSILALESFLKFTNGKVYLQNTQMKEEGLLFSAGMATRSGTNFRLNEYGVLVAKYGLLLEIT